VDIKKIEIENFDETSSDFDLTRSLRESNKTLVALKDIET
jgi:hypothetical protein